MGKVLSWRCDVCHRTVTESPFPQKWFEVSYWAGDWVRIAVCGHECLRKWSIGHEMDTSRHTKSAFGR